MGSEKTDKNQIVLYYSESNVKCKETKCACFCFDFCVKNAGKLYGRRLLRRSVFL